MEFDNNDEIKEHNNCLIKVYEELNKFPKEEILLIIGWLLINKRIKYSEILKHYEERVE